MDFNTKISALNRVGKTLARRFKYLGIETVGDLLYYFPFRYEDYRQVMLVKELRDGMTVTVRGKIELIANKRGWKSRKMITEAMVADESGSVRVVWFNQPYIGKTLKIGDSILLSGKVKFDMLGAQLVSPMYEKDSAGGTKHTARMVPMYPLTEGITQKQMRFLMGQVVGLSDRAPEWLPDEILEKNDLVPLPAALRGIHFPQDEHDLAQSTDRLKFGELFLLQMKAAQARLAKTSQNAPKIAFVQAQIQEFVKGLPFALTRAQKVAAWEILQDLEKPTPMNRLLSGDVGSGKTVIAAMAMYSAMINGYQSALMAPTEILASQHFASLQKLLPAGINVALLTRAQCQVNFLDKISKREMAQKIKSGEVGVVVGTHALLSEKVEFKNLGLTIVDEQHRFGVEQRKEIKEKTTSQSLVLKEGKMAPHFLSMTATPIPRSLALLLYGDLELSVLNEMPSGRKKIITKLVEPIKRDRAYGFIREQVKLGRQVFVVCPLIEQNIAKTDNPKSKEGSIEIINYPVFGGVGAEKKSVMSEYEKLSQKIFPDLRVAYLHGKMKDKDAVMARFRDGQYDILISTSVVEVGVDVPNASVMMIEGADRFGLAQLHQFRGRVGRSEHQSFCLLFTNSDSPKATERLKYFEANHDGFKLAEKDLEMRGPGEVYGTAQSGEMQLRLATLMDRDLIKKARESAQAVVGNLKKYPILKRKIEKFGKEVHLE